MPCKQERKIMSLVDYFKGKGKINNKTHQKDLPAIKVLNTTSIAGNTFGAPLFLNYDSYINSDLRSNIDLYMFFTIFERVFNKMFVWKGLNTKEQILLEKILFRNGQVAIIKITNPEDKNQKNYFITRFVGKNFDIYGYAREIKVVSPGSIFDNKTFTNDFIIIKNNMHGIGTLYPIWKRLLNLITALEKVDTVNITSDYKVVMPIDPNDNSLEELNRQWNTKDTFIKFNWPGAGRPTTDFMPIQIAANSKEKIELYLDQVNFILTYLGFKTSDLVSKAERQTEIEVSNNDKFSGLLFEEMIAAREQGYQDTDFTDISVSLDSKVVREGKENINEQLQSSIQQDKEI